MKNMGAEYTDFIRTTDIHHKAAVQYIWQKLQPHIYKGKYEGWYCVGHEAFFTDKEVERRKACVPITKRRMSGLAKRTTTSSASAFTDQIREPLDHQGACRLSLSFARNEFFELMKDGLHDVSISRPKKTLCWGVPVPGDPDQIMYVWLDALRTT